jgi:hypothetical protein
MIELIPFEVWHAAAYDPQDDELMISPEERMRWAEMQSNLGPTWTAMDTESKVIGIGGVCDAWSGRGIAWCGLSRHAGQHMFNLTKVIRRVHDSLSFGRIEMYTEAGNDRASRWAEMLQFVLETPVPMRKFLPDGRDAMMYAKVKP